MARLSLLCLILLLPLAAYSQTGGNIFLGYSYLNVDATNRSSLNGWDGSLEGKVLPFVGIVADLSGHYGNEDVANCGPGCTVKATAHQHNFLFGPRLSVSVGKITPFAHYLVGASHVSFNAGLGSDTSFAHAVGGGSTSNLSPCSAGAFRETSCKPASSAIPKAISVFRPESCCIFDCQLVAGGRGVGESFPLLAGEIPDASAQQAALGGSKFLDGV